MRDMAKRLAANGYTVLVPNPYYRTTKAPGLPLPWISPARMIARKSPRCASR